MKIPARATSQEQDRGCDCLYHSILGLLYKVGYPTFIYAATRYFFSCFLSSSFVYLSVS